MADFTLSSLIFTYSSLCFVCPFLHNRKVMFCNRSCMYEGVAAFKEKKYIFSCCFTNLDRIQTLCSPACTLLKKGFWYFFKVFIYFAFFKPVSKTSHLPVALSAVLIRANAGHMVFLLHQLWSTQTQCQLTVRCQKIALTTD